MKKRKIFKKITLAGLAACMFCLPILAGCAPAEMLPEKPTQGQNFDLGLNPETDPVVYTTQSGLQIKKSDAKYNSTTTTTTNKGNTYTQDLRGFYYFTMGKFSGTIYSGENNSYSTTYQVTNEPVNWLIIGKGPGFNFESSTPAGSAIQGEVNKQEIAFSGSMYQSLDLSAIPQHSDIPKGCFLVLSEKLLGQMYFNGKNGTPSRLITNTSDANYVYTNSGEYGTRYRYIGNASTYQKGAQSWTESGNAGGSLYNYINSLFTKNNATGAIDKNGLGFTKAQADLIVPQQLYTCYSNGQDAYYAETPSSDGGTFYTMFPLAQKSSGTSSIYQNFCVDDYLTTKAKRVASFIGSNSSYPWWLRSAGTHTLSVGIVCKANGDSYAITTDLCAYFGVRPAMVMKLQ